jgi:hypothetical protein
VSGILGFDDPADFFSFNIGSPKAVTVVVDVVGPYTARQGYKKGGRALQASTRQQLPAAGPGPCCMCAGGAACRWRLPNAWGSGPATSAILHRLHSHPPRCAGRSNLDVLLTLLDSNGRRLASANPQDAANASVAQPASLRFSVPAAGRYYVSVAKTGFGKPGTAAHYSAYGVAGQYAVSVVGGDAQVRRPPAPPPSPPPRKPTLRPPPPRKPALRPPPPSTPRFQMYDFQDNCLYNDGTFTRVVDAYEDDAFRRINIPFPFAFDGRYYHNGLNGGVAISSNGCGGALKDGRCASLGEVLAPASALPARWPDCSSAGAGISRLAAAPTPTGSWAPASQR